MADWHERTCRRPDVAVIDTMITCKSCGSFYDREDIDGTANRGELRKGVSEFGEAPAYLNLNWPSTVKFWSPDEVEDANIKDALNRLAEMLHEQGGQQQDHKPKSTIDTNSTSSPINPDEKMTEEEKNTDEPRRRATTPIYNCLTGVDEIRLLRLSPQKSADDLILHGYLESTSLSTRPEFTAVSYTWADSDGNRSLSEEIFLGDRWVPLPITRNCAAALHQLRSKDISQTFWVDSVCINQLDTDEKSHQVGLMRDIFSRATSVMIFLGGDEDAPDARLLKRTSESLFYSAYEENREIIWEAVRDQIAVRALFDRPYWSRIWVIQEVLLSRKAVIILGKTTIPLQSLLNARLVEPDGQRRKISIPPWLHLGRDLPVEGFHGLSKLLTETSTCLATDPKDMIFALLGLVQGAHLEGLVADYSKSLQEIRVGIAAYFLIRQGQIDILKWTASNAGPHERLLTGSPSWVPTWGYHSRNEPSLTDSMHTRCFSDFRRSNLVRNRGDMMWCYDILRPKGAMNTSFGYNPSSISSFRVLKGTGALLIEAYPLLCIDSAPYRDAFNYRSVVNKSVLLTPSRSTVKWGIYAAGERWDKDLVFGRPGDWMVEIPGFDDFFHLREIPSLPGAYRISSVCGIAIALKFLDVSLPDGEASPSTDGSVPPRYSNDELISRLIIFDRDQLQFLQRWEILPPSGTALGPSSEKPDSYRAEFYVSLSETDMKRYIEWADSVSADPSRATQPTSSEMTSTLGNVKLYLDRWQDLNLWVRIISDVEAVPWLKLLAFLAEVRKGFWSENPPESQTSGVMHDVPLQHSSFLKTMATELDDLLLDLTSRASLPHPASMMDAFKPILQGVKEADATTIFKVLEEKQDEIEKNLRGLESHLDFMRDSLPLCRVMRDKFSQRQMLKQLYGQSELREFLIY